MGKPFHAGKASMDGILSAFLAHEGFECSKEIIEGKQGFLDLFTEDSNMDAILYDLGSYFHTPTVSFKPYAACGGTHSVIDVMKELRKKKGVKIKEVEEIIIYVSKTIQDAAGKIEPKTGLEGKFSIYYCAALGLAEGEAGIDKFTDEKVKDPRLVALRKKVTVNSLPHPEIGFGAMATIRMKSGVEFTASTEAPKGDPAKPMSCNELEEKFRNLARIVIPEENVDKLVSQIRGLEEAPDIGSLLGLCFFPR
jgi:2-methylcitrate dehydratase PrpD